MAAARGLPPPSYNLNFFDVVAAGNGSCGNGVCEAGEDCNTCGDCDGVNSSPGLKG